MHTDAMARINDVGGMQGFPPLAQELDEPALVGLVTRNAMIGVAPV